MFFVHVEPGKTRCAWKRGDKILENRNPGCYDVVHCYCPNLCYRSLFSCDSFFLGASSSCGSVNHSRHGSLVRSFFFDSRRTHPVLRQTIVWLHHASDASRFSQIKRFTVIARFLLFSSVLCFIMHVHLVCCDFSSQLSLLLLSLFKSTLNLVILKVVRFLSVPKCPVFLCRPFSVRKEGRPGEHI